MYVFSHTTVGTIIKGYVSRETGRHNQWTVKLQPIKRIIRIKRNKQRKIERTLVLRGSSCKLSTQRERHVSDQRQGKT